MDAAGKPANSPLDRWRQVLAMGRYMDPRPHTALLNISWHDGPGGASPGADSIAANLGVCNATVREAITVLCDLGVLSKRKGRRGDHYTINYEWKGLDRRNTLRSKTDASKAKTAGTPSGESRRTGIYQSGRRRRVSSGERRRPPARSLPPLPLPLHLACCPARTGSRGRSRARAAALRSA